MADMKHVVLAGDSIFDNGVYTGGGPDVVTQVRGLLPAGWKATLLAVDGATTLNIPYQMERFPAEATHIVMSVGGNNALTEATRLGLSLFGQTMNSQPVSWEALADVMDGFERGYREAVEACLEKKVPTTVCTIYNGCFPDPEAQRTARVALTIFNDVILRVAREKSLAVIELRSICRMPGDYANPIEPSSAGGEKIARAIVEQVTRGGR